MGTRPIDRERLHLRHHADAQSRATCQAQRRSRAQAVAARHVLSPSAARTLADFPNLTVKKIPKTVLGQCEWGKDDYSLEIKNLPTRTPAPAEEDNGKPTNNTRQARKARQRQQEPSLFDQEQ